MNYRRVGGSGLQVSEISFGSWVTFGAQVDDDAARACMKTAYDAGINFFDNAEAYAAGRSEEVMGRLLEEFGWPRDTWLVSSKVFWGGPRPNQEGLSRKHVFEACHAALRRLRVDYLDLFYCHRPDPNTPIEETCWTMHQLIMQGKVLYWGTSMWSADEIMEAHAVCRREHLIPPVVEQPVYNIFKRWKVEGDFQRLYDRVGMGTTIFSPLGQGLLTGKYNDGIPATSRAGDDRSSFWLKRDLDGQRGERMLEACRGIEGIARELGISMTHLSIAWCLSNPNVSSAIMGATRPEQVEVNAGAGEHTPKITAEIRQRIDEVCAHAGVPTGNPELV